MPAPGTDSVPDTYASASSGMCTDSTPYSANSTCTDSTDDTCDHSATYEDYGDITLQDYRDAHKKINQQNTINSLMRDQTEQKLDTFYGIKCVKFAENYLLEHPNMPRVGDFLINFDAEGFIVEILDADISLHAKYYRIIDKNGDKIVVTCNSERSENSTPEKTEWHSGDYVWKRKELLSTTPKT